jgi:hypothetical protein
MASLWRCWRQRLHLSQFLLNPIHLASIDPTIIFVSVPDRFFQAAEYPPKLREATSAVNIARIEVKKINSEGVEASRNGGQLAEHEQERKSEVD